MQSKALYFFTLVLVSALFVYFAKSSSNAIVFFEGKHQGQISQIVFSSNGEMVASVDRKGIIKVWSSKGKLKYTFEPAMQLFSFTWESPIEKITQALKEVFKKNNIEIYNKAKLTKIKKNKWLLANGQARYSLEKKDKEIKVNVLNLGIWKLKFVKKDLYLAVIAQIYFKSGGFVWRLDNGQPLEHSFEVLEKEYRFSLKSKETWSFKRRLHTAKTSSNGKWEIQIGQNIAVWDRLQHKELFSPKSLSSGYSEACFTPDDMYLVISNQQGLFFFSLPHGKLVKNIDLRHFNSQTNNFVLSKDFFSIDRTFLVTHNYTKHVVVISVQKAEIIATYLAPKIAVIAMNAKEKIILCGHKDGSIRILSLP